MNADSERKSGRGRTAGGSGKNGLDPGAQGLDRISGVVPVGDKGVEGSRVGYYTTRAEFVALLMALNHHRVAKVGRADMSDAAVRKRGVTGPLGARVPIHHEWEGAGHWYLPDFAGLTRDGRPLLIEAGISAQKGEPRELAKLEAARAMVTSMGGELWVIAADLVPGRFVRGALALYLATFDYHRDANLLAEIRAIW